MAVLTDTKAYIIGGGLSGLAAAVYLITDGGMEGRNITIFERGRVGGGSFDGRGNTKDGYLSRGYRMFEDTVYLCAYDLFTKIPSAQNPEKSLKEDFFEFNRKVKQIAKARLVSGRKIIDARRMELSLRDKLALVKLLYLPEKVFEKMRIDEFFSDDFFKTNFWLEWSTTLAFRPWHSLAEMRRYLCRFIQDAPRMYNMSGVLSAPFCEHDFIILPVLKWLNEKGVHFQFNREVTDLEFAGTDNKKIVEGIVFGGAKKEKIAVRNNDLVFVTNGSMTADSVCGTMDKAPPQNAAAALKKSGYWALWQNLSKKSNVFGNPAAFCGYPEKTSWESFTITFRDPLFFEMMGKFTGNRAGTGGLVTFKDSNWIMTIALPAQPYFINQPANTFVCWGYGLSPENIGNFVKKKMYTCNGKEIIKELCGHLGFEKKYPLIIKNATCLPCVMPFITSQFMPRKKADRPAVVPKGAQNFAFIGQYVEIPGEIVFTVECSVRSAKIAVKKLLKLPTKIPPLHNKQKFNPLVFINSIRTIQVIPPKISPAIVE